jgi:hypothetical protein
MSFFGGITDFLTGGSNGDATEALNRAAAAYGDIPVPDVTQLTLPQLQQYVQAGIITPAQAAAVLQQTNAYNNISTAAAPKQAEMDALSKLQELADSGGMDQIEKSKLADTESQLNQTLQGQRLSILDQMSQRGIPQSLMGPGAELAFAGQDAEQAHKDALQANADAETRALQALEGSASIGGSLENQNYSEAAQKAAAQNAIDQWNAANQTTVNLNNANLRQQANLMNNQEAQNVSNANVQNANARTEYNAKLPQTVYQDKLQKAAGLSGQYDKQAQNYQHIGEQNAAVAGGILSLGSNVLGKIAGAPATVPPPAPGAAAGGSTMMADMGPIALASQGGEVLEMRNGGSVPGIPKVPGNSPKNDTVPALLSPGEVVVPRTAAHNPDMAANFVRHLQRSVSPFRVHPEDVKNVLHALTSLRGGR